ncbi:hypothetical protein HOV93_05150 [Planctomycetes bacterium FF15]|uniref:Tetratricopeptide repeat protein n=2 Tax=Bremerella alba TaxID=980252 RepID=A0A7V8V215_9BACT|nr:hypothetical protein [Bremerella alba]
MVHSYFLGSGLPLHGRRTVDQQFRSIDESRQVHFHHEHVHFPANLINFAPLERGQPIGTREFLLMTRNVIACGLMSCLSLLLTASATQQAAAQDTVLVDLYGRGVHAYNRGDYLEAYKLLDAVIEEGTNDPRAFYFLGLTNYKLGNTDEAQADFTKGAQLELDRSQIYPVGKALERVQGADRLMLEDYRNKVRTEVYLQKKERERARYEKLKQNEDQVLRGRQKPAGTPSAVPVPSEDETDPFGSPGAATTPMTPEPVQPNPSEPEMTEDAFGGTSPPESPTNPAPASPMAAPTQTDDPFGTAPSTPTDDPFGAAPMPNPTEPEMTEDPFGGTSPPGSPTNPAPASPMAAPTETGDPFGAAPMPEMTAPSDDPFGAAPMPNPTEPEMTEDPFGGTSVPGSATNPSPASPTEAPTETGVPFGAPPMPEMTAPSDDPFGAAPMPNPTEPEMTEDPFGGTSVPGSATNPSPASPTEAPTETGVPFGQAPAPNEGAASEGKPNPVSAAFGALGNALIPSVKVPSVPGMGPPAGAPQPGGDMPDGNDPFGAQPAPGNDPFGAEPDMNAAPVNEQPFGVPSAAPSNTVPSDDPFGAQPMPEMNAPSDDPFGAAPPSGNDPFGAAPMNPSGADPFGEAPAPKPIATPPSNDPFGASPAPSDDPFGASEPAADPFGN